jgi:hypothetical protein
MNGEVSLRDGDAIELGEMLEFLHEWIGFHRLRAGRCFELFTAGAVAPSRSCAPTWPGSRSLLSGDGDR